ncbi:hypothetical protein ACA910_006828 [Epithemia clementina (nom. ined.)]
MDHQDGPPPTYPHHPSYYRNTSSHDHNYPHPPPPPPPPHQHHQPQPGVRWEEGIPPPPPPGGDYYGSNRTTSNSSSYDPSYDSLLAEKIAAYGSGGYHSSRLLHQDPYSPSPVTGEETMVELGPGLFARLRGANETWKCIEHDFHVPVVCYACSLELCCIQDASYVLCPKCRIVSPVEQPPADDNFAVHHMPANCYDGGVGLGFTFDDLFKWQAEIMRRRRVQDQQRKQQQQEMSMQQHHPRSMSNPRGGGGGPPMPPGHYPPSQYQPSPHHPHHPPPSNHNPYYY